MAEDAPRLLLVEDSETQAIHFRHMVAPHGFRIERTRTAEEALERLNAELPDLLVVDYRLPGMNGDELVRIVRQSRQARTLPILMLTGDADSATERHGLDSGANAYVPKGGAAELLVSRLRALLRQRGSGREAASASTGLRAAQLLLIEQDRPQRALLCSMLAREGYEVRLAEDEAGALAGLDHGSVDGVLLDLDGSGAALDALRTIEVRRGETGEGFEIVGLLPADDPAAVLAALRTGADDVVVRGGDEDMLLVRIRAIVRRKLARDEEARAAAQERERRLELAHARAQAEAAEALAAANARLQETQAQLVQSAKMASLGELVAGIAHEINNPLAFILAHHATVERAVREAMDAEPEERARRLTKASDRLTSIRGGLMRIQDLVVKLRRFSRLDDETTQLDVPEAIEAVLTLLGPKLGPGVTVERRYEAPPSLVCSPALINQVVMNLVSNAADAVPSDGGRIRISTSSDGTTYRITVADNGPGIPAELRERIFEPFFTTKAVGSGTGLGLAIAYGIVAAHGGRIEASEAPEGGALFSISIPERAA